jgi:hypothetical protein
MPIIHYLIIARNNRKIECDFTEEEENIYK